jgi:hypothetical protein
VQSYWLNYESIRADNPILMPRMLMKSNLYCNRNLLLSILSLLDFYLSPYMYICIICLCIVIKLLYQHRSLWTAKVETQKGNIVITRTFLWKQTAVVAFQQLYLTYSFIITQNYYTFLYFIISELLYKRELSNYFSLNI